MPDGDSHGGGRALDDAFSAAAGSKDPARAEAERLDAERIAQERAEAARRLAAARAQIAEFDQSRRRGVKWSRASKRARETNELLEGMTRETPAPADAPTGAPTGRGYQPPDYDRPDNRDAAREVLAAFAETRAEADQTDQSDQRSGRETQATPRPGRRLRAVRARREQDPERPDPTATPPKHAKSPTAPKPPKTKQADQSTRESKAPRPLLRVADVDAPSRPSRTRQGATAGARTGFSMNVDFAPRTTTRSVLTLLVLLSLAGTIAVGVTLREDQNTLNVGITATLALLTLLLNSIRSSAAVSHLRVRGGLLEIKRGGRRDVFDLSSRFTPIEVSGRPGRPGWKVLMLRTDGMAQVIDASMVDPEHFTEVLTQYRPDLA